MSGYALHPEAFTVLDEIRAYGAAAFLVTMPEWEGRVFRPLRHGEIYEEAVRSSKEALAALIAATQKHSEPLHEPPTLIQIPEAKLH